MRYPIKHFHGIMFHHFHDGKVHKAGQGSISTDDFIQIIKFIGRDNILDPEIFYDLLINKKLKPNQYCMTFDDGIKCQFDIALPILEDFHIKAYFFIYTSIFTGEPDLLEVYRYFRINYFNSIQDFYDCFFSFFKNDFESFFKIHNDEIQKWKKFYPFYSDSDIKFRFIRDRYLTKEEYKKINFEIFDKMNFVPKNYYKNLFFNKKNLNDLNQAGHTIGLHTHNHPTLLENLSLDEQEKEYSENLSLLNELLNNDYNKIDSVSHPLGSYNKDTLKILTKLKIKIGFRDNMSVDIKKDMKSINNSNLEISRQDHSNIMNLIKL